MSSEKSLLKLSGAWGARIHFWLENGRKFLGGGATELSLKEQKMVFIGREGGVGDLKLGRWPG